MYTFLLIINVVTAIVMVGVILLQHGRGAEMGASFGRGTQGSLVGITGSSNFLSRSTSILATIFFVSALALGIVTQSEDNDQVLENLQQSSPDAASTANDDPLDDSGDDVVPAVPVESSDFK